jgi:uncharacterized OsmC-like protein
MDRRRQALVRLERLVQRRSGFGCGTSTAVTTIDDGLRCTTAEAGWVTTADLPAALGGDGAAPSPGMLLRAALGSCMAMSYRLRASRRGVQLESVVVTVETDSELAGMLFDDAPAPPGFTALRYHVEIASTSPPAEVERVIEEGDRLSPILDSLSRQQAVCRTVSITAIGG